jgi:two-component system CheB/CheR fusion protein
VFVQAPDSAKFDGMPRSAIEAGLVDVVAPVEQLPDSIARYLRHVPALDRSQADAPLPDPSGLEKIILLLRARNGHDFSSYKKSTLYRRIERRMGLHQLARIGDYVRYMRENPQETDLLFKELLIGVTTFFRDPAVWEQLKVEALPALMAERPNGGVMRAWVPACSTGEEAYSLAILFREALERVQPAARFSLQIFATDLDRDAIDKARAGVYPANIAADVTEERLRRFFVREERGYRVCKEIREMVIFAPQNLVMDPPFTKLDLLTCRNLLIYLEAGLQKRLLPLFHYSLHPGGFLVLGSSETVGQGSELFAALPGKNRIFRRLETLGRTQAAVFPATPVRTRVDPAELALSGPAQAQEAEGNLQRVVERLLLRSFAPAAVLVTVQGDILFISGKTGRFLEPAAGKANLNLFAMAREGLSGALYGAFVKAVRERTQVALKAIPVGTNGGSTAVDVTLQPLTEPLALEGMVLIVFSEVQPPPASEAGNLPKSSRAAAQLATLARERQQALEELQITREEMQTAQEELKSTNEELQSTNEELQSTNEELTTSKEEMQSVNEELITVNHELNAKVEELSRASDDMKNLLNSTDIATLFLDEELKVRRFTTQTAGIFKLIPGDAGRPITDLVSQLDYPRLPDDAREVLASLVPRERRVTARDGRAFKVRIMPYRTQTNRIDGMVLTFVDISDSEALEATLREALAVLQTRCTGQATALEQAGTLEETLQRTQAVLERRLAEMAAELDRARAEAGSLKPRSRP